MKISLIRIGVGPKGVRISEGPLYTHVVSATLSSFERALKNMLRTPHPRDLGSMNPIVTMYTALGCYRVQTSWYTGRNT